MAQRVVSICLQDVKLIFIPTIPDRDRQPLSHMYIRVVKTPPYGWHMIENLLVAPSAGFWFAWGGG